MRINKVVESVTSLNVKKYNGSAQRATKTSATETVILFTRHSSEKKNMMYSGALSPLYVPVVVNTQREKHMLRQCALTSSQNPRFIA